MSTAASESGLRRIIQLVALLSLTYFGAEFAVALTDAAREGWTAARAEHHAAKA